MARLLLVFSFVRLAKSFGVNVGVGTGDGQSSPPPQYFQNVLHFLYAFSTVSFM